VPWRVTQLNYRLRPARLAEIQMICPECESPMASGFAELHSSWADALFYRAAPVALTFAASESFDYELLKPAQRSIAFACEQCGTMVLTTQPWLP